jgi:hypothetical protein
VLELPKSDNNYKVVGAIYSQRIESADQIQTITADRVSELHSQNGSIVQLLAVNILPEVQERRLGDQLLEFMPSLKYSGISCKKHDYFHRRTARSTAPDGKL